MQITNQIMLDVMHARAPQTVYAKQDDSDGVRCLLVRVTSNRVPLMLTQDNIPTLRIYESGMEYAWTTGEVTAEGLALVHLPKFETSGVFQADVTIVTLEEDGTLSRISTEPFRLDVGGYKEFDTSAEKVIYIAALPVVSAADAGKVLIVSELGTWTTGKAGDSLPEVTAEDAGKVLTVSEDGAWGVMEAQGGTSLPEVTADDDGKVLTVVGGAWAPAEASEEEEPQAVSLDLSAYDSGTITETLSDGSKVTYTVTFDENGNPININNGESDLAIVWG